MKVNVLGVKIDDVDMNEALGIVEKWIWNPGKHYIVTPNPEMVVAAQKDPLFKKILNDADLSIPDGAGLKLSGKVKNTFAGVDFMEELVSLAAEKGFTTGFLGGGEGVAKKCAECLLNKYPNLKVIFAGPGGEVDRDGQIRVEDLRFTIYDLRKKNLKSYFLNHKSIPDVDILFVAFGHIKQEKWIANNLDKIPAHVMMGVGGSFDEIAGIVPRIPAWVHQIGLKWLARLVIQPWRIKRQLALIKYLWLILS